MHARRRPEQNRQQLDLGERAHAELLPLPDVNLISR
jgi:hypothetical protein